MLLDRVTITGADDTTDPRWMADITKRFPFLEWGILLSRSQEGAPRFPSTRWIERLKLYDLPQLSGHLCGGWVRALVLGLSDFERERPEIARMFGRLQLNFHGDPHSISSAAGDGMLRLAPQIIFQIDGQDGGHNFEHFRDKEWGGLGAAAVPLFDTSGGAGVEPDGWPAPIGEYSGYAGGLHPDRLDEQMIQISRAAGGARIWIDVETHVRSLEDRILDPAKVEKFLATAGRWVAPTKAGS